MDQIFVDWQSFAPVDAGRPFCPLFEDEYSSAYRNYTTPTATHRLPISPDVLVIPDSNPDIVLVLTRPHKFNDHNNNSNKNNNKYGGDENPTTSLTQILTLLLLLHANGHAKMKHIADLRLESGNQRVGIVLQQQQCAGAEGFASGVELGELVERMMMRSQTEMTGFEDEFCEKCDEDGWSYI
ncbi:MAG: hypothetical protein M1830_001569 [Pleopsidium flavum]|nr:MAG: hypothetical protein M1830_001569 [Pleopsidium flavum]